VNNNPSKVNSVTVISYYHFKCAQVSESFTVVICITFTCYISQFPGPGAYKPNEPIDPAKKQLFP